MHLLSFFIETASASFNVSTATKLAALLFAAFGIHQSSKFTKRHQRKLKWQLFKHYVRERMKTKKGKADGTTIFLLLLMIIACVAILWILWALGGIFALILGIVFGVGILTLIFKD
jgi:fatty acid desaturase